LDFGVITSMDRRLHGAPKQVRSRAASAIKVESRSPQVLGVEEPGLRQ
jgi:hypothetical protein